MNHVIRVLVVDDSRYVRGIMRDMLRDRFVVELATDGLDALEKFAAFAPDVIILDLNMPRLDGLSVIARLRGELRARDTYVIVLTGDEDKTVKSTALNLGANDFLTKRFDQQELLARMNVAARQILLNRQVAEEVSTVANLQARLLPRGGLDMEGVRVQGLYRSSGLASGDYYDYLRLPDGRLRLAVADVSGHGARAAFLMAIARTLFHQSAAQGQPLDQALGLLNDHLIDLVGEDKDFITFLAADLDPYAGTLTWINAGHCPGLVRTAEGEFLTLKATSPMLGFFPELPLTLTVQPLSGAFEVFLFTDGFYEWELAPGTLFGLERFLELCQDLLSQGSPILADLETALAGLAGRPIEFNDDLTALWAACDDTD